LPSVQTPAARPFSCFALASIQSVKKFFRADLVAACRQRVASDSYFPVSFFRPTSQKNSMLTSRAQCRSTQHLSQLFALAAPKSHKGGPAAPKFYVGGLVAPKFDVGGLVAPKFYGGGLVAPKFHVGGSQGAHGGSPLGPRLAAPKFDVGGLAASKFYGGGLVAPKFYVGGSLATILAHKTEKFIFRCSLVPFGALWCRFAGKLMVAVPEDPQFPRLSRQSTTAHHSSLWHSSLFLPLATHHCRIRLKSNTDH
jgi:hypothetical protein